MVMSAFTVFECQVILMYACRECISRFDNRALLNCEAARMLLYDICNPLSHVNCDVTCSIAIRVVISYSEKLEYVHQKVS